MLAPSPGAFPSCRGAWLSPGEGGRGWRTFWVVVNNSCVYYFKKKEDETPNGIVPLEHVIVAPMLALPKASGKVRCGTSVVPTQRDIRFSAILAMSHAWAYVAVADVGLRPALSLPALSLPALSLYRSRSLALALRSLAPLSLAPRSLALSPSLTEPIHRGPRLYSRGRRGTTVCRGRSRGARPTAKGW